MQFSEIRSLHPSWIQISSQRHILKQTQFILMQNKRRIMYLVVGSDKLFQDGI
jgi:hypothetical protein